MRLKSADEVIRLSPRRKILAPGEEENLELEEEEEEDAAGAGSTDAFPPRAPGTAQMIERARCCGCVISCGMFSRLEGPL